MSKTFNKFNNNKNYLSYFTFILTNMHFNFHKATICCSITVSSYFVVHWGHLPITCCCWLKKKKNTELANTVYCKFKNWELCASNLIILKTRISKVWKVKPSITTKQYLFYTNKLINTHILIGSYSLTIFWTSDAKMAS